MVLHVVPEPIGAHIMNIKTALQAQEINDHVGSDSLRIKLYEELEGGEGREIFFRPHRYDAEQFKPLNLWVQLTGQGNHSDEIEVRDLSQGGIALNWMSSGLPQRGDEFILTIGFDEQLAYVGRAIVSVVRRVENSINLSENSETEILEEAHVGLDLKDGLLKIDELLQTRDLKRQHTANAPFGAHDASWRIVGHDRFKAKVAEMNLFLDDWEIHFGKIEQQVSWDLLRAEAAHPTRTALLQLVKADFMPDFLHLAGSLYQEMKDLSSTEEALKIFSQRYLDERFMSAPWMYRARVKPLGYPGDYEVMNHIYAERLEGRTLLGQALNYSTLQSPAAEAVRNRKNILKSELINLCSKSQDDLPSAKVLSVAAGPAQEIFEFLSETETLTKPLEIVLFDQDPAALAFAYGRLKRIVDQRFEGQVKLIYLHDSIRRLLDDQALFEDFGPFDLVLCSGLYDYLRHSTAVKLTSQMFHRCSEGGRVFIGNMTPENPSRWIMEHHLEWSLLYRTHEEILSFAHEGAPNASKWNIVTESTGVNPFVAILK